MASRIKTFAQLRKYFDEPTCLVCGYSLRGLPAEGATCPECGAGCGRRDLVESICGRRWDQVAGVDTVLTPTLVLYAGVLVVVPAAGCLLWSLMGGWGMIGAGAAYAMFWGLVLRNAVRDFGSRIALLHAALVFVAMLLVTGGAGAIVILLFLLLNEPNAFLREFGGRGVVAWLGTGVALIVSAWLLRGVVVRACRSRCRAVCEEWLARSANPGVAGGNHEEGDPH